MLENDRGCGGRFVHLFQYSTLLLLLILLKPITGWSSSISTRRRIPIPLNFDRDVMVSSATTWGKQRRSEPIILCAMANSGDNNIQSPSPLSAIYNHNTINSRREHIKQILISTSAVAFLTSTITSQPSNAYTPDQNPLRESLYLISRVQEATVQQERFVNRASQQDVLKNKMKLTLRLVEKNYKLLDQITLCANYVTPEDKVVDATTFGYEAAEALQTAIDYVNSELGSGDFKKDQKEYLISNLKESRERLFDFLDFMPKDELLAARKRVEEGE